MVLGSMVEEALARSVDVLRRRDTEGARVLVDGDAAINRKRFEIEEDVLTQIATQAPMASDMRILAAVLEVITELERVGDYAKGIAHISLLMGPEPLVCPAAEIPTMACKAREMLRRALDAFVRQDVEAARAIPREDDEMDVLYNKVYRGLLDHMMANPRSIDRASYLLWVAHNLERAADRVTNICERVVFAATGEMKELGSDEDWN
jgi:phosphate transport system protein